MFAKPFFRHHLALLAALILCGCSAAQEPHLIASYPKDAGSGAGEGEYYFPVPDSGGLLEVQVADVGRAVRRAESLALAHHGYVRSRHEWREENGRHALLCLTVPLYAYDALYKELSALGYPVPAGDSRERPTSSFLQGTPPPSATLVVMFHPCPYRPLPGPDAVLDWLMTCLFLGGFLGILGFALAAVLFLLLLMAKAACWIIRL